MYVAVQILLTRACSDGENVKFEPLRIWSEAAILFLNQSHSFKYVNRERMILTRRKAQCWSTGRNCRFGAKYDVGRDKAIKDSDKVEDDIALSEGR